MVLRLVFGILALTFVPIGVIFTVIGLTVDEVDEGDPQAFVYIGIPILAVGLGFAGAFFVLWRKERARRARRRAGLRARAEIVSANVNWSVRVNGKPALKLTVRFGTRPRAAPSSRAATTACAQATRSRSSTTRPSRRTSSPLRSQALGAEAEHTGRRALRHQLVVRVPGPRGR